MNKKILLIANEYTTIINFRMELISALVDIGHIVAVALPAHECNAKIRALGCKTIDMQVSRKGINPLREFETIKEIQDIVDYFCPDIVFTFTIKPNIYGCIACRSRKIPAIVNITGLGTAVENPGIMQRITLLLYKYALRKAKMVFFQNTANRDFMLGHHIIKGDYDLLPGSGVNLSMHIYKDYPCDTGEIVLLFVGRLMRDKGIEELIEAAKRMQLKESKLRFIVVGASETDYSDRLKELGADKYIELVGHQSNVDEWLENAHALVHPSYHEGMSNVCLEAAACGRPVLASDIPGCRETFEEGVSGFGFQPRDVDSLCEAIEKFIALSYEKKAEMGRRGREKVEREFDRNIVVEKYMEIINEIKEDRK